MHKIRLKILGIIVWCSFFIVPAHSFEVQPRTNQVCFKDHCFDVEVVTKSADMAKGLQERKSLPADAGMLFVFSRMDRHSFWMKDTLIPLDIIWLDYAHRVVYIHRDTPPCTQDPCAVYMPPAEAVYVLELNAHRAQDLNIQEGNLLEFHLLTSSSSKAMR